MTPDFLAGLFLGSFAVYACWLLSLRLAEPKARPVEVKRWLFRNSYEWSCPESGVRVTTILPPPPEPDPEDAIGDALVLLDKMRTTLSNAEDSLATLMKWEGIPKPSREYVFATPRRWRFDFAWWERKVAVEVEGGHWIGGHGGSRFEKDAEKYNEALLAGWRVYRVTPKMVEDGRAVALVKRALA